jgi:hypothetical protein
VSTLLEENLSAAPDGVAVINDEHLYAGCGDCCQVDVSLCCFGIDLGCAIGGST